MFPSFPFSVDNLAQAVLMAPLFVFLEVLKKMLRFFEKERD